MKKLTDDSIQKFKDKFYKKKVSQLFLKGTKGLKPIDTVRMTERGEIIVPTRKIIEFFQKQTASDKDLTEIDIYFSNLYRLFDALTKGSEDFFFESDLGVSEKNIQEADNKKNIEYLTVNLIITYFNNIKTEDGKTDYTLLTPDFDSIIDKSKTGRDYKTLVGKTLQNLVQILKTDQSWRDCLVHIHEASMVCKLVGSDLPQIDNSVLSGIILESRKEIKSHIALLDKILNTRDQTLKRTFTDANYIKLMNKLDSATRTVFEKIDDCLRYAHRFTKTTKMTTRAFLGNADQALKECVIRILTAARNDNALETVSLDLNYSVVRHRLTLMFEYTSIVNFFKESLEDETCQKVYHDILNAHFQEVIKELDILESDTIHLNMKPLSGRVSETIRTIEHLSLQEHVFAQEKETIRNKYIGLLRQSSFDRLDSLMEIVDAISLVTQDYARVSMDKIRHILVDSCFSSLTRIPREMPDTEIQKNIQKLLYGYANHYKPVRSFYQKFFSKYIGENHTPSLFLTDLAKSNKKVVLALLLYFSNQKTVSAFISKDQISDAETILGFIKSR